MGKVTLQASLTDPGARVEVPWDGSFLEFMEACGPSPERLSEMSWLAVDMSSGRPLPVGDEWLEPIGDRHIVFQTAPGGIELPLWAVVAIVVASVALSVAATFLLTPKPPEQANQDGPASVYSVKTQANQAKLGGPIPEQFGTWERTPEYASQSYRVFADNEEIRHFLLCLGKGDHDDIEIRIGDTPVADLPSGIVTYEVYKPADHTSTLGVIDADFGTHENVVTNGEVENLELEPVQRYSDTINGTITGTNIIFNDDIADAAISAGDEIEIISPAGVAGTKTIASVTSSSISVTTAYGGSVTDANIEFIIRGGTSIERGPFTVNRAGTTTQTIELDVEWPAGLFKQKDNGSFKNIEVELTATVQEIDDEGNDVGSPTTHVFTETGASNTPLRRTYSITKSAGRYKVSLTRSDDQETRARDSQRTVWTGLKAYLDYDLSADVYGDVTLLAMKITGAQAISSSSQSRIFVKSTRTIVDLDGDPVTGSNLADVMKFIYCNQIGRPETEIDAAAFEAFQAAQASRSGFNGLFDTVGTVWDALSAVAFLGRAKPYPKAMTLSLVVDEVKANRTANVTPLNVLKGGIKEEIDWIEPGGYDGVVVQYFDGTTYERKTVSWPDEEDNLVNPKQETIRGLTDDDEALSHAKYLWRQITLQNRRYNIPMEMAGRNYKPYDRLGLVWPSFNYADAAQIMASSGTSVTLDRAAPSGSLYVQLTDTDGTASDVVTATGDGSRTIILDASPPFTLESDGSKVRTTCAFGLTSDFPVQDIKVMRVRPSGNRTTVEAVNYTADLFTDLV